MLENVYRRFNTEHFSPEKYRKITAEIFAQFGDPCLRLCETPVFLSRAFAAAMVQGAVEIIQQCMAPALRRQLDQAVAPAFRMPSAPDRPSFFIIDFAVTKDGPRLIEMQAFASNLAFIPAAANIYKQIYGLDDRYRHLLSARTEAAFVASVQKTILGRHAPENVILLEINPWQQQSRRDFIATQQLLGIPVVDVTAVIKKGEQLFYRDAAGRDVLIRRIYNRVIPAEFQSLNLSEKTQFKFTDPLDVEWAGDPGWFLRVSKYAMPYLDHPLVPATRFLDQVGEYPADLENYVLKPVFLHAGLGVKINLTQSDLDAIPAAQRHEYILMRKVKFLPFIPDLKGNMLNAEIRLMFVWPDRLEPVAMSARVMHGYDTNENLWGDDAWCGLAPVMILDEEN